MSELKTCPFCGCSEIIVTQVFDNHLNGNLFQAVCVKCGCRSGHHDTIPAMAAQWNTRTPDPRVERLVEALARIANTCEESGGCPVGPATIAEVASAALAEYTGTEPGEGDEKADEMRALWKKVIPGR